jgi:hypothetical protein
MSKYEKLKEENTKKYLLYADMIRDAYKRMSSNREENYRAEQLKKINIWLEEMTLICEEFPDVINSNRIAIF